MALLVLLLLPFAVNSFTIPSTQQRETTYTLTERALNTTQNLPLLPVADSFATLTRVKGVQPPSSILMQKMRANKNKKRANRLYDEAKLHLASYHYLIDLTVGKQNMKVMIDTGSSDTWVFKQNVICMDENNKLTSASTCNFGQRYHGKLDKIIPNEVFEGTYGDTSYVTGKMGTKDVTVAGIRVSQLQIALVDRACWTGDNVSSGMLGLAYRGATSGFEGNDPNKPGRFIPYDPLVATMIKQNLPKPVFSIALDRHSGGSIAFGGVPPISLHSTVASTPIELLRGDQRDFSNTTHTFYLLTIDAINYKGSPLTQKVQFMIDASTPVNILPKQSAQSINALFSPPAKLLTNGFYIVDCNATAPAVAVTISGVAFTINAKDMIYHSEEDGECYSGVQAGFGEPHVLGSAFMNNVVVVFDIGASQMKFVQQK